MISIPMTINSATSIPVTVSASVVQPTGQMQAKTNINPTTSSQTITPDTGYDGLSSVQINAMPSGSATTPATSITANPSISVNSSTGVITASVSKTQSVTPTVSAGYVASGTAGTVTVSGSNTSNLTTQGAQTIHPSSSDQTIASGKYLTGAQTIKGVTTTNLTAANIKKDVVIEIGDSTDSDCVTSVTGSYEGGGGTTQYKGTFTPASRVGSYTFYAPGCTYIACLAESPPSTSTGKGFVFAFSGYVNRFYAAQSNNSGTGIAGANDTGKISYANDTFTVNWGSVSDTSKIPQVGITYNWCAWGD